MCGHSGMPGRPQVVVRCINLRFACNIGFQAGVSTRRRQDAEIFLFERKFFATLRLGVETTGGVSSESYNERHTLAACEEGSHSDSYRLGRRRVESYARLRVCGVDRPANERADAGVDRAHRQVH